MWRRAAISAVRSLQSSSKLAVQTMEARAKMSTLPHLPVPPLKHTMDEYVRSLAPVLSEDELQKTIEVCNRFQQPGAVGEMLQMKLKERAAQKDNWLDEWWTTHAYLGFRRAVPIHSNPGFVFANPSDQPIPWIARILTGVLRYKEEIVQGTLPLDYMRDTPLCMHQYSKIFSQARIPKYPVDELIDCSDQRSNHFVVLHRESFYAVPTVENGADVQPATLDAQLRCIVDGNHKTGEGLGALTCLPRDDWAAVYKEISQDSVNKQSLETLNSALFIVCLDENDPDSDSALLGKVLLGDVGNRWFDKLQLIFAKDGRGGILMEHAPLDAIAGINMVEAAMSTYFPDEFEADPNITYSPPEKLEWKLPETFGEEVAKAKGFAKSIEESINIRAHAIRGVGKEFFKEHKLSPDACFQVIMQLTYYRLHGKLPMTYETAQTRQFLKGRTETTRTASIEGLKFVKAMASNAKPQAKAEAFRDAVTQHNKYSRMASSGQGVDRHLMGLKLIAAELGIETPELFTDKGYAISGNHNLSTSNVYMKVGSFPGFGPTAQDGYGVCYNIQPYSILTGVSNFKEDNGEPATDADKFAAALDTAVEDVCAILLASASKM